MLVVEDNEATRALIEETLQLDGYRVVTVSDGRRALWAVKEQLPAVVILDVMMSGSDGFSVLESLRAADETREVPVVMLTALDDNESTWRGWSAGCHYYMTKPFEIEELTTVVRRLVEGEAA